MSNIAQKRSLVVRLRDNPISAVSRIQINAIQLPKAELRLLEAILQLCRLKPIDKYLWILTLPIPERVKRYYKQMQNCFAP